MSSTEEANERAAAFVDYYASPQMMSNSVNRLYYGGVERRRQSEVAATEKYYPPAATPRRTKTEQERYLHDRVQGELLRRQQHRAALQQALYPEQETPARVMSEQEMQRHIEHVYRVPLVVRQTREAELRRIFGADKGPHEVKRESIYQYSRLPLAMERQQRLLQGSSKASSPRAASSSTHNADSERGVGAHRDPAAAAGDPVAGYFTQLEQNWRQPSAKVKYDDNRRLLVSQYDYYADPRHFSEVTIKPHRLTAEEKKRQMARLEALSRPQRVNPPVKSEEDNQQPKFRVWRRLDHKD